MTAFSASEMLDWLDGNNVHLDVCPDASAKVTLDVIDDGCCTTFEGVTVRQAITHAMIADKRKANQ